MLGREHSKLILNKNVRTLNQPVGGRYIASEKQVSSSFNSSFLWQSYCGLAGGDVANPTPASLQIIPHCKYFFFFFVKKKISSILLF